MCKASQEQHLPSREITYCIFARIFTPFLICFLNPSPRSKMEKNPFTCIFSFCHSVFKSLLLQGLVFYVVFNIILVILQQPLHLSILSWNFYAPASKDVLPLSVHLVSVCLSVCLSILSNLT